MNDLIVVAGITHRAHLLDEYEQQLKEAAIEFYLWDLNPLPDGIGSLTARRRFQYLRDVCTKFASYSRIVITDGWDVLFFGEKDELLAKVPPWMLVSAERNCWPEPELESKFESQSPWKFANPGMISGSPEAIMEWVEDAEKEAAKTLGAGTLDLSLDLMDQQWFNRAASFLETSELISLDEYTSLFYVVSADKEDGALRMKDGKPWNSRYNMFPAWLHFAGPCHPDPFRALLRGEVESLGGKAE